MTLWVAALRLWTAAVCRFARLGKHSSRSSIFSKVPPPIPPLAIVLAVPLLLAGGAAVADGGDSGESGYSGPKEMRRALDALDRKDYEQAIPELKSMAEREPDNPDVFNLLGFSHRKLGRYDEALGYYQQALDLKPDHLGANEYLGELYLQTGKLDKARERLAILDKACFLPCREYRKLKRAIARYEKTQ